MAVDVVDLGAATATQWEGGRKVFRNTRSGSNKNFYVFYRDDADDFIRYAWSSDGTTWNTVATAASDIAIGGDSGWSIAVHDDTGSSVFTFYLFYGLSTSGNKLKYRRGTVGDSADTITFSSAAQFGGYAQTSNGVCATVSTNGRLFVSWSDERSVGGEAQRTFAWDVIPAGTTISGSHSAITETDRLLTVCGPNQTNDQILVVYMEGTTIINAHRVTGPTILFGTKSSLTSLTLTRGLLAGASDTQTTVLHHFVYRNGSAVEHRTYDETGAFSSATTVVSVLPDSVSCGIDKTASPDKVMVAYVKNGTAGDFFFKLSDVDTISFGSENTVDDDSESLDFLAMATEDFGADSKIPTIYTIQTTFKVRFNNTEEGAAPPVGNIIPLLMQRARAMSL